MKKFLLVMVACGLMATTANAAYVWIENADNGSDTIDMTMGDSGWMNALIQIAPVDNAWTGFNLRFDTTADLTVVDTEWAAYPGWSSSRAQNPVTPFPPGLLGSLGGYGIWSGEALNVADALGAGTYLMDSILFGGEAAMGDVTINLSTAGSEFYREGGTYNLYPVPGAPAPIPNWYALGIGDVTAPLHVNIPEPASLALLAIGGLALIRRR
jgi:hypothetical protein